MRCRNVISLKEVAEQSPEFNAEKIRCPKCGRKWLGGVLEERKQDKDKDKDNDKARDLENKKPKPEAAGA